MVTLQPLPISPSSLHVFSLHGRTLFPISRSLFISSGPSPSPLNCFQCAASNEQDCIAMQSINECTDTDFVCITVSLTTASSSNFTKSCAAPELCDLICPALNESGSAQSCVANCCNTSECNAGSPTTVPPMTTEMTPITDESSTTTMAPTTTAAPIPTTALGKSWQNQVNLNVFYILI